MIKYFNKKLKTLDVWDIALIKLSVFAFALLVVAIWPAFTAWVVAKNPWCFVAALVIFAARPFYKAYLK